MAEAWQSQRGCLGLPTRQERGLRSPSQATRPEGSQGTPALVWGGAGEGLPRSRNPACPAAFGEGLGTLICARRVTEVDFLFHNDNVLLIFLIT